MRLNIELRTVDGVAGFKARAWLFNKVTRTDRDFMALVSIPTLNGAHQSSARGAARL